MPRDPYVWRARSSSSFTGRLRLTVMGRLAGTHRARQTGKGVQSVGVSISHRYARADGPLPAPSEDSTCRAEITSSCTSGGVARFCRRPPAATVHASRSAERGCGQSRPRGLPPRRHGRASNVRRSPYLSADVLISRRRLIVFSELTFDGVKAGVQFRNKGCQGPGRRWFAASVCETDGRRRDGIWDVWKRGSERRRCGVGFGVAALPHPPARRCQMRPSLPDRNGSCDQFSVR